MIIQALQLFFVVLTVLVLAAQLGAYVTKSRFSREQFITAICIHCTTLILSIYTMFFK